MSDGEQDALDALEKEASDFTKVRAFGTGSREFELKLTYRSTYRMQRLIVSARRFN